MTPVREGGTLAVLRSLRGRPRWLLVALVAALAFAGGYSYVFLHWLWYRHNLPQVMCEQNLRTIYIAMRKLPLAERQGPCPAASARVVLGRMYALTADDIRYLNPSIEDPPTLVYSSARLQALVCMLDPDYARKVAAPYPANGVVSSYIFCPDERTLAYCPYHRYALLKDGRIEKR